MGCWWTGAAGQVPFCLGFLTARIGDWEPGVGSQELGARRWGLGDCEVSGQFCEEGQFYEEGQKEEKGVWGVGR